MNRKKECRSNKKASKNANFRIFRRLKLKERRFVIAEVSEDRVNLHRC